MKREWGSSMAMKFHFISLMAREFSTKCIYLYTECERTRERNWKDRCQQQINAQIQMMMSCVLPKTKVYESSEHIHSNSEYPVLELDIEKFELNLAASYYYLVLWSSIVLCNDEMWLHTHAHQQLRLEIIVFKVISLKHNIITVQVHSFFFFEIFCSCVSIRNEFGSDKNCLMFTNSRRIQ